MWVIIVDLTHTDRLHCAAGLLMEMGCDQHEALRAAFFSLTMHLRKLFLKTLRIL